MSCNRTNLSQYHKRDGAADRLLANLYGDAFHILHLTIRVGTIV